MNHAGCVQEWRGRTVGSALRRLGLSSNGGTVAVSCVALWVELMSPPGLSFNTRKRLFIVASVCGRLYLIGRLLRARQTG